MVHSVFMEMVFVKVKKKFEILRVLGFIGAKR